MKQDDKKLLFVLLIFIVSVAAISIIATIAIKSKSSPQYFNENNSSSVLETESIFPADVNLISRQELMLFDGIGEKTADSIISYREENGEFKNIDELLNVDGIGEKTLEKLKEFLFVENPQQTTPTENPSQNEPKTTTSAEIECDFPADVNLISKQELMLIDGIGEKTADNIISYREKNGKFKSIDELLNVDGIGEKTLEKLKEFLFVENSQQTTQQEIPSQNEPKTTTSAEIECDFPADVNLISRQELMLIDGIGEKTADSIISYREKNGEFKNIEELLNVDGIGEKTLEKLKEFLFVENPQEMIPTENPHQETTPSKEPSSQEAPTETESTPTGTPIELPLNINTATFDELMQLDGMTEEAANSIISHRSHEGCEFVQILEVLYVVDDSVYLKIKDFIIV